MYERIETTNPPTQHVNPRYAHSAKGGPRLAAASAEKGICLRAERRRGAISRTQSHSSKLKQTQAHSIALEPAVLAEHRPELAVINRHQIALKSTSYRHQSPSIEHA